MFIGDVKMNKSERLNDMMIYLNNKSYFNLTDLMEKYNISRSTAIRDVQSLEQIGMPIFSEHGRYGRYGILKNRLLSPIIFTTDEMYAMYFSMLTLKEYQSTPFDLDLEKLKLKFESCISKERKLNLDRMETVFSFTSLKQVNNCPFLKDVLYLSINDSVCDITYKSKNNDYKFTVQFLNISTSFGQWYVTAYNYDNDKMQVFRCDKILSLSVNKNKEPVNDHKIETLKKNNFKEKNSTDFEVNITEKGVDLFIKENYPSMTLAWCNNTPVIKGYYNKNEEDFISSYFSVFGKEIIAITPPELKELIIKKIEDNMTHIKSL